MVAAAVTPGRSGLRFDELARCLEVLANPNRLRLLQQLVNPKTTSEISLRPEAPRKGENPERRISRQGVQLHLERLASIGVIATTREPRGKALVEVHTINYPRMFAFFEELRTLSLMRATREPGGLATIPAGDAAAPAKASGPHVAIVRGLHEGTIFPLDLAHQNAAGTWLLGRKRGLPVCLDYDPFVSAENSEFVPKPGGRVAVRTLPPSRNGTTVNWELLRSEEERVLEHGDIVGAGRTLLLFRQR